ncbi:monocarboxylate transporter 14-like [Contarinia nasturtii]|uniref:monocarboxylate transporter 14-like n=1 Tax=Contarinia nasturtii TaxID=265458 RepID=UPI0012D3EC44|nr:monocarboxylate transporter 14-like [Contarinia nasturtii]XP_031623602.1 monocarboxylate transporter 14-like [Contarinia nasturtii]XP_031623603.1 monocarboxylate transporter 14-like [Contarinia nasturtii]XP_031623605.1 monocarboxylate transporter 14-like [Contarinia nasturtii]
MDETITNGKFRTKKVAPEGGWGYFVGIGLSIFFALYMGSLLSFGLMFNDFFAQLNVGTSAVTIVHGAFFSSMSFACLFSSTLFKKFSMRSIGLFGAFVYFFGSLMTIFVYSVEQLIVSFGVLQGSGIGFMAPVGYSVFNQYFVKKRVFMMGIAQTFKGIIIMLYPMATQFLLNKYGFRGTLVVIAAINAHTILGMLVMQPIEWHYKETKVPVDHPNDEDDDDDDDDDDKDPFVISYDNKLDVKVNVISEDGEYEYEQTKLPCDVNSARVKKISLPNRGTSNNSIYMKCERSKSLDPTQKLDGFKPIRRRMSSVMSIGDFDGVKFLNRTKKGKMRKVIDFLDLTLLKDLVYVNIVLGISFGLYSDNTFFALLPMYLFELHFSQPDVAMIVSCGSAADLASRVCLAIISLFVEVKARNIFWAGSIAVVLTRFVFLNITSVSGMVVIVAVLGFFRTWLHVPISLVFADHLAPERFPAGYSLFMFFQGNFAFLIGPFIGWIRDFTKSYIVCFNSLSFILCLCVFPWLIEAIWMRMHSRKKRNTSTS